MRVLLALAFLLGVWSTAPAQEPGRALRPGNTISIQVFQDPKLDRSMLIGPTGMISYPMVGDIRAAGLSPPELAKLLKARLQEKYAAELDVTVSLVSLGVQGTEEKEEAIRPRFYVTGEVNAPGAYAIGTGATVLQGIALAGGLDRFAAKRRIQVRRKIRGVETVFVFDYAAFEAGIDLSGNIYLRPNDVIVVPERGLFELDYGGR
jgi:polysaccharide biosynthesis/export protein